jgi:hypothetical protein
MAVGCAASVEAVAAPPPFVWLISHQPTVLFSQNKPATNNQSVVLFSQNKPAPAISHQPNEQADGVRPGSPGRSSSAAARSGWCAGFGRHCDPVAVQGLSPGDGEGIPPL